MPKGNCDIPLGEEPEDTDLDNNEQQTGYFGYMKEFMGTNEFYFKYHADLILQLSLNDVVKEAMDKGFVDKTNFAEIFEKLTKFNSDVYKTTTQFSLNLHKTNITAPSFIKGTSYESSLGGSFDSTLALPSSEPTLDDFINKYQPHEVLIKYGSPATWKEVVEKVPKHIFQGYFQSRFVMAKKNTIKASQYPHDEVRTKINDFIASLQ